MTQQPDDRDSNSGVTHVYDDIVEHDNPLPRWWLVTFFGTIVFGVFYFYRFEVFHSGPTQAEELASEQEAQAAKLGKPVEVSNEELVAMSNDPAATTEGAAVFASTCAVCHGANGEGKIGPNLTDGFWLHGGKPAQVFHTISTGVPDKGMPTWEPTLGHFKTERVAAYVLTLRGKNTPGKEPQGEADDGK
jgi:cytochrome c oxidase cbb3-type subunit 3